MKPGKKRAAEQLPKYLQVKQALLEGIASQRYSGARPIPPEKVLAGDMGVAPMTARRAIQELVAEGLLLRQRGRGKGTFVRTVGGLARPRNGAGPDAGRLTCMGVLHRYPPEELRDSPVYMLIYMEIQAECSRSGIALQFLPGAREDRLDAAGIVRLARESGCQAVLVLDWWRPPDLVAVQEAGLPVIVPGPFQETVPVSSVSANEYQGAYAATEHLLALGHPGVAIVNSRKEVKSTHDRYAGWLAAVGLEAAPAEALVYRAGRAGQRSGGDFEETRADLLAQFRERRPPSAIFARDGFYAYAAMGALKELGLSCPGDVSMTCLGTYFERALGMPRMTAAGVRDGLLGREVVRLAQDLASGRQDSPLGIQLPMQLLAGETTRAAGRGDRS